MRIYFHLKHGHEVLLDVEGVEASDPQDARVQAALAVEEFREEFAQHWSGWTLTAVDAGGRFLFAVDLDSKVWTQGAWVLSLLFLQGSELRQHLAHVLPDILPGSIALLV